MHTQQLFLFSDKQKITHSSYLNERRGAHLIFYLSEGVLIRGGLSFKLGHSFKKCKVGTS